MFSLYPLNVKMLNVFPFPQLACPMAIILNFPRISGHTERIEIKEENFIKEVCYGTRKEKKV
jgi:hypothetical protein